MQFSHRFAALSSAALAACAVMSVSQFAQAAPGAYQTAVTGNSPYLYYRLQETGALQDAAADNLGSSASDGIYRGADLIGGIAGLGAGSDTAVSFPGTNDRYVRTTDAVSFGSQVPQSSYEFLFKTNVANPTIRQALFGVVNSDPDSAGPRTQNAGLQLELNTANVNNIFSATTTRFWVRDELSNLIFGNIAHGNLTDGQYHHFVVTLNLSEPNLADQIKAYVDGAAVSVTVGSQGTAAPSDFQVFTRDPVFAARNNRGSVDEETNVTLDEVALYGTVLGASDVEAHATAAGFVVPEPGSLALAGFAGVALLARRRREA
jgi:hypothetical protein